MGRHLGHCRKPVALHTVMTRLTRRGFLGVAAAHAGALLAACDAAIEDPLPAPPDAATLVARPHGPTENSAAGLGGFSNGASYALSLGVYNGDLFSAIVAFSPGFYTPPGKRGLPRIFVSHGTNDPMLMNATTPQIVPRLKSEGYSVTYRLFEGGHELPVAIAQEAIQWLTAGSEWQIMATL